MNRKNITLSLIPLLLSCCTAFGANPTDVLRRAEVADRYISYRGMKIASICTACSRDASIIKIVHLKPDKTRTEYFSPEPLAGIILIQDGPNLWRYDPDDGIWDQAHPRGLMPPGEVRRGLCENYEVRLLGMDRVAGRQTYVIQASPKHPGETTHRIWIDKDYYLIVKTQVESPRGAILNSSRYTEIDFNPKDISLAAFKVAGKVKPPQKLVGATFKASKPRYLPDGYKMVGVSEVTFNGRTSVHLQFSNGANTFSLFERATDNQTKVTPIRGRYTTVYTWTHANMVYTLIGDIPSAELRKIANSMD